MKPVHTKTAKSGKYGDDQDPTFTDSGEEYARTYYALQTRKFAEAMSPKVNLEIHSNGSLYSTVKHSRACTVDNNIIADVFSV